MIIGCGLTTATGGKELDWDEQENWWKDGPANTFVLGDNLIGTDLMHARSF